MNDQPYHEERFLNLKASLEGVRRAQRFYDGACKYGVIAGLAGLAVGCAMESFGGPEYRAFASNLMALGLITAAGSVCCWGEFIVDSEDEMKYLERRISQFNVHI